MDDVISPHSTGTTGSTATGSSSSRNPSPLPWDEGGGTGTGGYICPLGKLRAPVRARVEELLTGNDKALQQDDLLISFLSELQTAQALKVLEVYSASMQRQTNKIKSPAGYLMRLIQTAKHGSGNQGSLAPGDDTSISFLSPGIRKLMHEIFNPIIDRVVYEDRPLMGLLAKLPERQIAAALEKYQSTLMLRGRSSILNPCGYLVHQLKQVSQEQGTQLGDMSTSKSTIIPLLNSGGNWSQQAPTWSQQGNLLRSSPPRQPHQQQALLTGRTSPTPSTPLHHQQEAQIISRPQQFSPAYLTHPSLVQQHPRSGPRGWNPLMELMPTVREEWFRTFHLDEDRGVYEDIGLIKQLSRLDENKGIEALKTYQQARAHNGRPFDRPPAYLMGILRNYISGVKPLLPTQGSSTGGGVGDKGHNKKKRVQAVGLGGSVSLAGGGVCGIQRGEKYDSQISPTPIFPEATSGAVQHPPTPPLQERPGPRSSSGGSPEPPTIEGGGGVVPHYEYSKQSEGVRIQLPSPNLALSSTISPLSGWQLPSSTLAGTNVMAPRLGPIGQQRQTGSQAAISITENSTGGGNEVIPPSILSFRTSLGPEIWQNLPQTKSEGAEEELKSQWPIISGQLDTPQIDSLESSLDKLRLSSGSSRTIERGVESFPRFSSPPPHQLPHQMESTPGQRSIPFSFPVGLNTPIDDDQNSGTDGVRKLMDQLRLSKHADALVDAEIDISALHLLKEEDLEELGLPKGPRIKLLHHLQLGKDQSIAPILHYPKASSSSVLSHIESQGQGRPLTSPYH